MGEGAPCADSGGCDGDPTQLRAAARRIPRPCHFEELEAGKPQSVQRMAPRRSRARCCLHCRQRYLACDGLQPCSQCRLRGIRCTPPRAGPREPRPINAQPINSLVQIAPRILVATVPAIALCALMRCVCWPCCAGNRAMPVLRQDGTRAPVRVPAVFQHHDPAVPPAPD
jgi:hypothetical protein